MKLINNYVAKIAIFSFMFVSLIVVSSANAFAKVGETKPRAKAAVATMSAKNIKSGKTK